jgi:subtilisin family serine protease
MRHRRLGHFLSVLSAAAIVANGCFGLAGAAHGAGRTPNDPLFGEQGFLRQIHAPEAWTQSLGFEGVTVAVIDTGVDLDHPDLRDNIWRNVREVAGNGIDDDLNGFVDDVHGWDFVDNDNDPSPDLEDGGDELAAIHGTVSAGVIAARGDNGQGVVGVTWQTAIMPLRGLDANGSGETFPVVRAIDYAISNGAKIINLSFIGAMDPSLLAIAARRAFDNGVLVIAAAGNGLDGVNGIDLDRQPLYPACLDLGADENFVVAVAATDEEDRKASFSNYGAGCVDLSAPGVGIFSTRAQDDEFVGLESLYGGPFNGTSVAAPVVAGVAALVKAVNPQLTPKQLLNILSETAVRVDDQNPGFFGKLGRGRVDAAAAVSRALTQLKPLPSVPTGPVAAPAPAGSKLPIIAVAPGAGRGPDVRLFTADGLFLRSFPAYAPAFRGGVSLAVGRFVREGALAFVTGAGQGGGPQVRIFDQNGTPVGGFFAYDSAFRGGVNVAVGDLDGDGVDEIVTGAGPGGGPHVRVLDSRGNPRGGFFAYEQSFRGGVRVLVADLDGDGKDEIVVSPATGNRAAKVYSGRGEALGGFPVVVPGTREIGTPLVMDVTGDAVADLILRRATGRASVFGKDGVKAGEWDEATGRFYRATSAGLVATGGAVRDYALAAPAGRAVTVFSAFAATTFVPFEAGFKGGATAVPLR